MEKLLEKLKYEKLIFGEKVLVGVSTGMDSMVLLDLLTRLKEELRLDLHVAHVNHQKRKISDVEEDFIVDYCEKLNVKVHVKRLFFESESNFQAEARRKRYDFFHEIATKEQIKKVVLAHHGDDNMETILLRLIRGTNLLGYAGMKKQSEHKGIQIVRPLLEVNKRDITAYAKDRKIKYFEDESNYHDFYKRNRIRQNIVPFLYYEDPNIHERFTHFSETVIAASEIVEEKIQRFMEEHVVFSKNKASFVIGEFKSMSPFIQKEIVFDILKDKNVSLGAVEEIIKQIHSDKANIVNYAFEEVGMLKEYDRIHFVCGKQDESVGETILDKPGTFHLGNDVTACVFEKNHESDDLGEKICYNIATLPVIARNRMPGDRILLSGGMKKIGDLFIDLKIPKSKRDKAIVLTDKEGNILAIVGIKISETLRNTKETRYRIEIKENKSC